MNYIYDVLCNFQNVYYDFYDWNKTDDILRIRKIPIIKVNDEVYLDLKNNNVKVSYDFLENIKNKTEVFKNKYIDKINYSCIIANNLETWEKYRVRLTDSNLFIHNPFNPEMLEINTTCLNNDEIILINKCIHFLEINNQITYTQKGDCIEIKFLNEYIKGFIFKSGTWFEIFTKLIIKEIKNIDDVKSGVVFFWSKEKENVKNELDVVAVKDSVLICISCKDSKKYDEVALNELNIYANQLGGANVKKILVATMEPSKSIVINRAKEMGISIVVYNGNRNKFKNDLQNIICKQ